MQQRQLSDRSIQWLFIAPTVILLLLFNIFPLFYSLYLSFTDYTAIGKEAPVWVGFQNFASLLNDPQMWKYFATTGRYAFLSVTLQTLIGFGLAMLLREK
jgi:multiple sugar transport system permease protein